MFKNNGKRQNKGHKRKNRCISKRLVVTKFPQIALTMAVGINGGIVIVKHAKKAY